MKRSEWNPNGEVLRSAPELSIPIDHEGVLPPEISPPAEEIAPCAPEIYDSPSQQEQKPQAKNAQRRRNAARQQVSRLSSYLVAAVLTVAVLSNTLTPGSGSGFGSTIITDIVEALGGNTNGDLRFSIYWNDGEYDPNDLDAHCVEPGGYLIYYGNREIESPTGGTLDVDIVSPSQDVPAVENIVYPDRQKLEDGVYLFRVHCFSQNGGTGGFKAEVAIRGRIYRFTYDEVMEPGEYVNVAKVTVSNGRMTIERWPDDE